MEGEGCSYLNPSERRLLGEHLTGKGELVGWTLRKSNTCLAKVCLLEGWLRSCENLHRASHLRSMCQSWLYLSENSAKEDRKSALG